MAEEETTTEDGTTTENEGFTQADVDRIVADRLKRERAKYADYDELKEKAEAADKAREDDKSEVAKLTEQLTQMQNDLVEERRQRHIIEITADKGLTPAHVKRLTGSSREELEESADELLADFPIKTETEEESEEKGGTTPENPAKRPSESLKPGAAPPQELAEVRPGMGRLRAAYEQSTQ